MAMNVLALFVVLLCYSTVQAGVIVVPPATEKPIELIDISKVTPNLVSNPESVRIF